MKRNYVTYYVLRASLSHTRIPLKDIYFQLAETIAERKRVLRRFEDLFLPRLPKATDIHSELAETLAERKRILQRLNRVLSAKKNDPFVISNQQAA